MPSWYWERPPTASPPNALARLTPHPPCEAGVSESSGLGQRFCILLSSEEFSGRKQNAPPVKMQPRVSLYKVFFQISWVVRRHIPLCSDPLSLALFGVRPPTASSAVFSGLSLRLGRGWGRRLGSPPSVATSSDGSAVESLLLKPAVSLNSV